MMEQIQELLDLSTPPVAMSFCDEPPEHVPHVGKAEASGCTYWRRAAEGESFYTEAADHYNCPIGCHTHNVELPAERAGELHDTLGLMGELGYIAMEEVPGIPRRQETFRRAVYSPLKDAAEVPDVVIVSGEPRQMMLLAEAAVAAGVGIENSVMGRPTCAMIPAVMQAGRSMSSLGCIGNRVYAGLSDDEFYFALPGKHVQALVDKLETIVKANQALEEHHRQRQAEI
ncbi:MAG: hypothetical protein F4030_09165 [Gammaproteobacteria bacterium]|nr:hypothetical protein [Gammaproteobacteria bacterium]MYH85577.1 hypothetical protein [Gammaproteobacteria bacterium]MYK05137.1 hypothetical protein [Gammaproteobacteria bacterium]